MSTRRRLLQVRTGVSLPFVVLALMLNSGFSQSANRQLNTNSSNTMVGTARDLGPEDASKQITVNVWLNLHNKATLDKLVEQMYEEGSPTYHHWLTMEQYKTNFAPSTKDAAAVREFQSGKRTYRFRRVPLDGLPGRGSDGAFALILDRNSSELFIVAALMEAASRFGLSTREQETVELVLRGLSSRDIAERMKISHHTVRTFLRMVMVKMDVASRSEIVAKVLHSC